jgi:HSP20 family protein
MYETSTYTGNTFTTWDLIDQIIGKKEEYRPKVKTQNGDSSISLEVELPGLSKKDVKVDVKSNNLKISGADGIPQDKKFFFLWTIPVRVDKEKIEAQMSDGLLKITLPFREESTTQIEVR